MHGELLDDHGEFFVRRQSGGGGGELSRRQPHSSDPTAADASEWHHGFEVSAEPQRLACHAPPVPTWDQSGEMEAS